MSRNWLLVALNTQFGLSLKLSQLVSFLKNHKISSGRTGRYEKGNVPWTAGLSGTGICKPNSGSFKKGTRPSNYKPIGYERVCKKDGYVLVKVAEVNPWDSSMSGWYRHKHVVEWEKVHGQVPDGFCIRFVDGDKTNFNIENLTLVNRGENARLNQMGYNSQPSEIKPTVMALAKVDQAIYERT
ncbi:MAG: HNH endonuclease [Proteobacteria bacterium]|nr:HNH endonuclease [Pseudomonadota bacterium]